MQVELVKALHIYSDIDNHLYHYILRGFPLANFAARNHFTLFLAYVDKAIIHSSQNPTGKLAVGTFTITMLDSIDYLL